MPASDARNRCTGLESLPHYRAFLFKGTPAALLRLGQNFFRFHVVTRVKHKQKTTSKFARYRMSGSCGGRPTR